MNPSTSTNIGSNSGGVNIAGAVTVAPNPAFNWDNLNTTNNNNNNNDDIDDFDSDEDDSYSWASGITDHQDDSNKNNGDRSNSNITANWRDWKSSSLLCFKGTLTNNTKKPPIYTTSRLVDICAKFIAENIPFELVETFKEPIPEDLQLKITLASFPDNVDNIKLYSCLVNGTSDEYLRGEQLYQNGCVKKCIQIGFHLSAQVCFDY
jgi:hypothetical protein